MTSQNKTSIDASERKTPRDLPPIMTTFDKKPLPPVKETRTRPPPPLMNLRNRHIYDKTEALHFDPEVRVSPPKHSTSKPRKREGTKMSLFNLFNRPKVEKLRGYTEPGLALSVIDESGSRSAKVDVPPASTMVLPRASTAMSWRNREPCTSPPANTVSLLRVETAMSSRRSHEPFSFSREPRISSSDDAFRRSRGRPGWVPIPLFQAYAQSVHASNAQTTDGAGHLYVARHRRGSVELSRRPDKPHRNPSISSVQYSGLPTKIFILTTSGYLLQYADQGVSERLPERVLQLSSESVAFVCDLIPGEPYVLQIAQSVELRECGVSSTTSLLSRMGLRGSVPKKEVSNLLMIFRTAKEMDSWIIAVRGHIQTLDGGTSRLDKDGAEKPMQTNQEKEDAIDPHHSPEGYVSAIDSDMEDGVHIFQKERIVSMAGVIEEAVSPMSSMPGSRGSSTASKVSPKQTSFPIKSVVDTQVQSEDNKTLHDSPMSSVQPGDSSTHVDQVRKQFPFKIRSSFPEDLARPEPPLPQPRPAFASVSAPTTAFSSPMNTPRNTQVFEHPVLVSFDRDETQRPDSIITDLPVMCSRPVPRTNTSTSSGLRKTDLEMRQADPKLKPFRTSEPNLLRRPTTNRPAALPLKVNPIMTSQESTSSSPVESQSENGSPKQADDVNAPHSRRTSSVKLSLFPTTSPVPSMAPIRPVVAAPKDVRSLRRPASLQVRSNPAPFLSSVRSTSGTRQPLKTAGSTPSLRSMSAAVSASGNTHLPTSSYKFTTSVSDLNGNAFHQSRSGTPVSTTTSSDAQRQQMRNTIDSTTAPPRAGTILTRPKTSFRSCPSPGLPVLDLGIPIIGLAPPAPPPTKGLPSLPTAKAATAAAH